jgi:hypothetical protein
MTSMLNREGLAAASIFIYNSRQKVKFECNKNKKKVTAAGLEPATLSESDVKQTVKDT